MEDVTFNVALSLEHHAIAADRSHDLAPDDNLFGPDAASDARALSNDDVGAVDVALNLPVNLHLALGCEVSNNRQVCTNH